jgi:FlaG/FlaF family flagellin (archaellin)
VYTQLQINKLTHERLLGIKEDDMKKILIVTIVTLFFVFTSSHSASIDCLSASLQNNKSLLNDYDGSSPYWHCVAISNSGWGEGGGLTEQTATENAICNCEKYGYLGDICKIDHCNAH